MSNSSTTTKRIFISDLHMGDARSMETHLPTYKYPYGWLMNDGKKQRIDMLADFINYLIDNQDEYDELIILGDLLDHWVCPAELNPTTFQLVVDNPKNKEIIANLKTIASDKVDIKLYYVPGNHDMSVTREFMESTFPGITFIGQDNIGVFESQELAAEHGSQYTLFCAPNPESKIRLPIGFFISRAAAQKKAAEGKNVEGFDVLLKFIDEFFENYGHDRDSAMRFLFEAIAQDCGLSLSSQILMGGQAGFGDSITVTDTANLYADLIQRWSQLKPNGVSSFQAILNEVMELEGVARRQYFEANKKKIVVFGHTHKHKLTGYDRHDNHIQETIFESHCDYIYANSGTWINSHKYCTFVETERNPAEGKHYVRVCRYDSKTDPVHQMGEKYIEI